MLEQAKKILVIRLSSLGDIILTTPVIRAIKNKFPQVEIDFLTYFQFIDLLKFNPNLQSVYSYAKEGGAKEIIKELEANKYDFVIDLQNNRRSRKICDELKLNVIPYTKPSVKKFLLVHTKINLLKDIKQIPERYAENITEITLDKNGPEIFLNQEIESSLSGNKKYVGICPGSKHYTKMWPKEYFIELCKSLIKKGFEPVLMGGLDDAKVCKYIEEHVPEAINSCKANDILQIAADMKKCSVVICNDSGMMHTATAVGVPVITIFGSSVKEFGFTPYNSVNLILENNSVSCRPCSHIGKSTCKKKHFNCMRSITPRIVTNEFLKFYENL